MGKGSAAGGERHTAATGHLASGRHWTAVCGDGQGDGGGRPTAPILYIHPPRQEFAHLSDGRHSSMLSRDPPLEVPNRGKIFLDWEEKQPRTAAGPGARKPLARLPQPGGRAAALAGEGGSYQASSFQASSSAAASPAPNQLPGPGRIPLFVSRSGQDCPPPADGEAATLQLAGRPQLALAELLDAGGGGSG
eukprot:SAG22_NODE_743_length_7504_cov_4.816745_1_plen_191_part_10